MKTIWIGLSSPITTSLRLLGGVRIIFSTAPQSIPRRQLEDRGKQLASTRAILMPVSPAATLVEALEPLRSEPAHAAVLLDIDGTLAPIVRHAADAHVPEATRSLLIEIAKRYRVVGCVSGRRAATARQIVSIGTIAYVGNHGGELLRPGSTRAEVDPELAAWTERVRRFAARAFTAEHQRLRVRSEDKDAIAAFHWRGAPDEAAAAAAIEEIAQRALQDGPGGSLGAQGAGGASARRARQGPRRRHAASEPARPAGGQRPVCR